MIHRRREPQPPSTPPRPDVSQSWDGELMFVTNVGPEVLSMDCVLDFGPEGHALMTLAAELPENTAMALFEEALIKRWVEEGRFVAATLTVSRDRSRLTLTGGDSHVILPLRAVTRTR